LVISDDLANPVEQMRSGGGGVFSTSHIGEGIMDTTIFGWVVLRLLI
jgi:hypothetical protein